MKVKCNTFNWYHGGWKNCFSHDNGVYIKDTDVSVGIIDTTTVDEGDWEGCDDHNDSEDSAYIVVASGRLLRGYGI